MKPAHRRGRYNTDSKRVTDCYKQAGPNALCWRDGLPLDHHPPHHNGKPPTWQAGHTIDGNNNPTPWLRPHEVPPPGNWLAGEASICNVSHGNNKPNPRSKAWFTT